MSISAQDALVYIMVVSAAADAAISDQELVRIGSLVERLPVFEDYDLSRLPSVSNQCVDLMHKSANLEDVLDVALKALPERLHDTAYALAVEVVAVDLETPQEELRWLEMLRDGLQLDRLTTAAIERAANARLKKL